MTDSLSPAKRRWNMSRIRSKNTKPEILVRSALHKMGYRFRLHQKYLPGTPDIILPKYNTVIFVHGCFWHRHDGCKYCYTPKSRENFWRSKFQDNVKRDIKDTEELINLGWRVIVIWECEAKKDNLSEILQTRLASMNMDN
jgi:DNA mismatch endonuclease (patch repair protein)